MYQNMDKSLLTICNQTLLLKNWSDFCLDNSFDFPETCYPSEHYDLKFVLAILCVVFCIIGFAGNLLTIIAIPYAAKKKK